MTHTDEVNKILKEALKGIEIIPIVRNGKVTDEGMERLSKLIKSKVEKAISLTDELWRSKLKKKIKELKSSIDNMDGLIPQGEIFVIQNKIDNILKPLSVSEANGQEEFLSSDLSDDATKKEMGE